MSSFNRVTLMGNLTRDPELKRTKSGATLTELGMAINRSWTNENGQRHDETTFVDVTVWGKQAENAAKYLQKGRSVLIEGRLQLDSWQDTNTGQHRSRLRVVAESVQFLSNQQPSAQQNGPESVGANSDSQYARHTGEAGGSAQNDTGQASPVGWEAA
ncbi:MAG: single-stranded DNA-binding protein [Verrucomicrobiales bacterium]